MSARGMDSEDVAHLYNGKNKERNCAIETWMDLETVIQSEMSERKTNTLY